MGVGGAARWFVEAGSETDVCAALAWARQRNVIVHLLGGGSNVVVSDDGVDGLVIKMDIRGVESMRHDRRQVYSVGAGEPWDPFVATTIAANCAGLECLSGIPGSTGGTPVQNVGAYGQDVSGSIIRVHVVDRDTQQPATLANAECGFGYRTSRFKREDIDRFVVTRVDYALVPNAVPTIAYADLANYFAAGAEASPSLARVRDATIAIRRRKGMVIEAGNAAKRSCGSFFVNPTVTAERFAALQATIGRDVMVPHYVGADRLVKVPAAWLIERAGFGKGFRRGPVGVSPFQAQAIVNHGGATAADVVTLAADIKRAVLQAFSIAIVPEPVFVGFAAAPELSWLLGR